MDKILEYGMVGGGEGGFIGDAHRRAIRLDGKARLVAGCFSRSYDNTLKTGKALGVPEDRLYTTFEEMARREAKRQDRIDFVSVVTPNASHFEICKAFLNSGIHVSCEKPLAVSIGQAAELKALVQEKGLQLMVTYVYSGHVTAMHARELIKSGAIGEIRSVVGEYPQGWLAFEDITGNKQGEWRTDPGIGGRTNALGDIGTHIENTVYRMTGLKIKRVLARMDKIVPGRRLDDSSFVMVEFENGANGMYWASQIAIGHDNSLRIRIYGSLGSILWFQEQPEVLKVVKADGSLTEIHRGYKGILPSAAKYQRLPSGHSEGWYEAMANLYSNFIDCLLAQKNGTFADSMAEYPTVIDGADGVAFIEACLKSAESGNVWINIE